MKDDRSLSRAAAGVRSLSRFRRVAQVVLAEPQIGLSFGCVKHREIRNRPGSATNFRTPDMGGRKPVRFLGFRARLRPRNASPIPCRGTWCESRSSPRKAFRGLAIDAAN